MNPKRLDWDFAYHAPDEDKVSLHASVNDLFLGAAHRVNELVPDSREKSLAITALEEARMWANAAIARKPRPEDST